MESSRPGAQRVECGCWLPREGTSRSARSFTRRGDQASPAPWCHSWFHVERIWADLRAPQPSCHAAAGLRWDGSGDLITRRSRVRIPPPLWTKGPADRAFRRGRGRRGGERPDGPITVQFLGVLASSGVLGTEALTVAIAARAGGQSVCRQPSRRSNSWLWSGRWRVRVPSLTSSRNPLPSQGFPVLPVSECGSSSPEARAPKLFAKPSVFE
jgi:hypothetical protein